MNEGKSLLTLTNPLISSKGLIAFREGNQSLSDADLSVFRVALFTQTAGILLRLPQEVIATSIVLLQRCITAQVTYDEISMGVSVDYSADSEIVKISAASTYLAAKQSFYPLTPRSIVNVYALLASPVSSPLPFVRTSVTTDISNSPSVSIGSHHVSEGTYQIRRDELLHTEKKILTAIGFDTRVSLPHAIALTYLQVLSASIPELSENALAYLNGALLSPQLLYLTHQPNALAVAAIYLAAREQAIPLVDEQVAWWEVFDVGREELGFLVLSLGSLKGYFHHAQEAK